MKTTRLLLGIELFVFLSFYLWNTYDNVAGAEDFVFIYPFNLRDGSLYVRLLFGWVVNAGLLFGFLYGIFPWWKQKGYSLFHLNVALFPLLIGVTTLEWTLYEGLKSVYDLPEHLNEIYGMNYIDLPTRREIDYPLLSVNAGMLTVAFLYALSREQVLHYLQTPKRKAAQLQQELNYLRAQINPHFLFNALNNIYAISIKNEDDESAEAIQKLSGMMRYMLYDTGTDWVRLEEELQYISDYIGIQSLRYSKNEIVIHWQVDEEVQNLFVPPLLFIPFIENAFKYGLKIGQTSTISIRFYCSEEHLNFSCQNPIQKEDSNPVKGGIGIENVRKRLELIFPEDYSLLIGREEDVFNVHLTIPLTKLKKVV